MVKKVISMPSNTTHYIFSEDVYKNLDEDSKKRINKSKTIYNTFAQSHDLLFFYIFDRKNSKTIKDLGHHAHHYNTQSYLLNIIKEIKKNKLENNSDAIAYLYGVITHYVLDTHCHPYIFYKTGVYRKYQKWTHKYKGEHTHIEKELDAIYYKKYFNKPYNKCNLNKEIIKKVDLSENLQDLISKVYKDTYNVDNVGYFMNKSIKRLRHVNTLLVHDPIGIKKCLYYIAKSLSFKKLRGIPYYSNFILKPKPSWLNNEHKEWNHPCFKDKKYTYSFDDLFKKSTIDAIKIINEVNKVLYGTKKIEELKKSIPNIDYSTGIECNDKHTLEYFEY